MAEFLIEWLVQTWVVTVEAAPWLLGGFLAAGLIYAWVPVGRIATHLGPSTFSGVLKAAILGMPLPLCSCSVIPVASSMRRSGASRGATAGFLISTPETGVDSIAITYALLGPVMAILRPLAAVLSAVTAGLLINRLVPEQESTSPAGGTDQQGCAGSCACEGGAALTGSETSGPTGLGRRLVVAVRYGFADMFADLAIWLIIGFILAGLISALVPEQFLDRTIGSGWLAMLVALGMGLPLYVCATSSTPIAAALMAKGLSPGTALVFLLVGPATNIATMVIVAQQLGRRCLVIYLLSIGAVAVSIGVLVDLALVLPAFDALRVGVEIKESASPWSAGLAGLFVVLLLNGIRLRYFASKPTPCG